MEKLQLLVVLVVFVCNSEAKAQIQIDSAFRELSVSALAAKDEVDWDHFSTDEVGQIDEDLHASVGGDADSFLTHASNIYPFGILASGFSSCFAGTPFANADSNIFLDVFFTLDEATPYRLSGVIDGGLSDSYLQFNGETLHVINQTFDFSGVLQPGEYNFRMDVLTFIFGGEKISSSYDVSFKVGLLVGDVNCDGVVSLLDVAPFVDVLTSGEFQAEADINQDGVVDLLDVGPFVDLLSGG